MRFATVLTPQGPRGARVDGNTYEVLDLPDAAAAASAHLLSSDVQALSSQPSDASRLGIPTLEPRKILCTGLNYETHILEMGRQPPAHPTLFAKFAQCLIGPSDDLVLPAESDEVDWEAELAIVVGRSVRRASSQEARDAIAGYTVANDVSMRDWQWRTTQWLAGKAWDRSTPVGPVIVTPDEVDHASDLLLTCHVDGELVQSARTSDLVFGPGDLVSYASQFTTLEPGDLLLTGTPGGVGAGRDPRRFLAAGNEVRTEVQGIGELVNVCVTEEG